MSFADDENWRYDDDRRVGEYYSIKMHRTLDGRLIKVKEMSDSYLLNAYNWAMTSGNDGYAQRFLNEMNKRKAHHE
jgi:uncharacterized protein YycO